MRAVLNEVQGERLSSEQGAARLWSACKAEAPEIAAEISGLGFSDDQAGRWLIQKGSDGLAPGELIADGYAREVLDRLARAKYGMF